MKFLAFWIVVFACVMPKELWWDFLLLFPPLKTVWVPPLDDDVGLITFAASLKLDEYIGFYWLCLFWWIFPFSFLLALLDCIFALCPAATLTELYDFTYLLSYLLAWSLVYLSPSLLSLSALTCLHTSCTGPMTTNSYTFTSSSSSHSISSYSWWFIDLSA